MGTRTGRDEDRDQVEVRRPGPPPANGGAVYGLGLIGALVWFWREADTPADRAVGVLKALVWPAILVYRAFEVLSRR